MRHNDLHGRTSSAVGNAPCVFPLNWGRFQNNHVYLFSKAGGLEATLWYRCLPDYSPDVRADT